jgi:exodeoxyribonuclease VII small subunit
MWGGNALQSRLSHKRFFMSQSKTNLADFEANMNALADIVSTMEKGDLGLADSLTQFQEGLKRIQACHQALNHAEQTIAQLTQDGQFLDAQDHDPKR